MERCSILQEICSFCCTLLTLYTAKVRAEHRADFNKEPSSGCSCTTQHIKVLMGYKWGTNLYLSVPVLLNVIEGRKILYLFKLKTSEKGPNSVNLSMLMLAITVLIKGYCKVITTLY